MITNPTTVAADVTSAATDTVVSAACIARGLGIGLILLACCCLRAAAAADHTADLMQATRDRVTSQIVLTEGGKPVLQYNYQSVDPGDVLKQLMDENRKYARPRSDYIHPLYGLDGEVLTKDWSVDHPHHRGIYWAWPEVTWHGEMGDLHALQRVFARPTGRCVLRGGPDFAEVRTENRWLWDDREPIVREEAIIRAYRSGPDGRWVDLEFHFVALGDDVGIARRDTDKYGGLNLRFAASQAQDITTHIDPESSHPRAAWASIAGLFPGAKRPSGVTILQSQANPDCPGEWVAYPNLNWLQPTFPKSGTRYILKKNQPLVLRFRLWIYSTNTPADPVCLDQWQKFQAQEAMD